MRARDLPVARVRARPRARSGGRSWPARSAAATSPFASWDSATATAVIAVAITQALRLRSRGFDVAFVAVAMLPACTFMVMVASAWSRRAFARQSKHWAFIHGASAGCCVAAVALAFLWEALDPVA